MGSPDNNLRIFSPMKNIGLISSEKKEINEKNFNSMIQGKKIDFNDDLIFNENEPMRNPNAQNVIINHINNQNISYKNNISLSSKKIINRTYIGIQHPNNNNCVSQKQKCTCSKTGCRKKYCNCFANGVACDGCECKNCENTDKKNIINLEENDVMPLIRNNNNFNKNQRIICNCTKSNCMKKYCECFKQDLGCNSLCRCVDCKNKIEVNDNNNINNNYQEFQDFSGSFFPINEKENIDTNNANNKIDYRLPANFATEAFGILVRKEKLEKKDRELDLSYVPSNYLFNQTPKFSKKKRMRNKNESANLRTCPTTNSANRRGRSLSSSINKNIMKKKLQLN